MESALKKHYKLTWRQILTGTGLLLLFAILTLLLSGPRRNEEKFQNAAQELFCQEMIHNTLNMHYTIAHPEDFGIGKYEARLPGYVPGVGESQQEELEKQVNFWKKMSDCGLDDQDAYTRKLLALSLENSLKMQSHSYYDEPLSPASGMQSQLPILLAEYTFRTAGDVEDYLTLLSQSGEYYDSLLVYEQEKAAAGLPMSQSTARKVRQQCRQILTGESLAQGNHFLQTTFQERINDLYIRQGIDRKTALSAIHRNNELLSSVLLPAYKRLDQGLSRLSEQYGAGVGSSDNPYDNIQKESGGFDNVLPRGLATYPEGQDYYRQLLIAETGSYRPPEELYDMLKNQLLYELNTLRQLIAEHPSCALPSAQEECLAAFPYTQPLQMLEDLQKRMSGDFPSLAVGGQQLPTVTVKTVSDSLADYTAPAFYLTPPLDDTSANVIYVNEKDMPNVLELYTTLAHEGYPGHLYQSVYSRRYLAEKGTAPVRQLLSYGGYQEGWALYVEFIAYDYACNLLGELGQQDASWYMQAEKTNRSLLLCLYSLLDLMIHYEGATCEQIAAVLDNFGIDDPDAAQAIYAYIAEEPANYPQYYVGYLEILELKEKARAQWGADYTDLRFHTFFLNMGPSDFTSLADALKSFP